ncbi:MAG TPA: hypothetical protein VH300_14545 [Thermoleophilaceae bacterium]|jgi:hypothetical protein|nr:hypothetical protein [Thermoleophilaceae bacterium]
MDQLDSPQLRSAARTYADAARRFTTAPFWRRKNAGSALKAHRRAYVRELIRTAEARRLEA